MALRPPGVSEPATARAARLSRLPSAIRRWRAGLSVPVVLVVAAMLAGAALRSWDLGGVPPSLNQDEAVYGYDAYSLLQTGRDHLGHPLPFTSLETFGDWSSPLLTYLSIPAVAIFGLRMAALRGVSAAVGVAAIPIVYLLAVELFRRRSVGVTAAWLLAVSPWHVHLSRWAIIPTVVPTMVALTMLLLVRAANRRSDRGMVAAAVVAGVTVAGYHAMKLYVPLLLLAALAVYWRSILGLKREALAYAAALFLVIAGPIFYLTVRDPGGGARLAQTSVFKAEHVDAGVLAKQYLSYFSPRFLFVAGDRDPMHTPSGYGVETWYALPLLVAGLVWLVVAAARSASPYRQPALFVLLALALYPAPGSITVPSPHTLRAAHLIPLLALIGAAGAVALADVLRRSVCGRRPAVATCVLTLAVAVAVLTPGWELARRYRSYFTDYPTQVAYDFHYGIEEALAYARAHEGAYDEVWVTGAGPSYIYVLFFNRWPPSDVHSHLQVRRHPPQFNQVDAIGRYRFGEPAGVAPENLTLLETVYDPAGRAVFEVRGGAAGEHGRILFVHRP